VLRALKRDLERVVLIVVGEFGFVFPSAERRYQFTELIMRSHIPTHVDNCFCPDHFYKFKLFLLLLEFYSSFLCAHKALLIENLFPWSI